MNPVKALTSGKITKNDIGKTVYISNSNMICQEWVIADINHDDTEGTVDLVMKYLYSITGNNYKMSYGYSSDGHSGPSEL